MFAIRTGCALVTAALGTAAIAADLQPQRLAYIDEAIRLGLFHKLEKPARLCHLWVGPAWPNTAFDTKATLVGVVHSYCITADPAATIVVLKDYRTGKDIGDYSNVNPGLRLR